MSDQIRSMPPPLIPLPSPTKQYDPNDPFDSLFSEPGPSRPLFPPAKSKERSEQANLPPTPSSAASEFGAFISVPASTDPLHRPPDDDAQITFSPVAEAPSSSEFFERFTVEAKERAGQNERRVLDELLEHEDDPLYWLNSPKPPHEDAPSARGNMLVDVDELIPPSPELASSSRHPTRLENATLPLPLESPPGSPLLRQNFAPSLSSSFTSTLSRKWMSTLLSNSVPSPPRTSTPELVAPPAHFTNPRRDSVTALTHSSPPTLTHSTPFAPHVFVPPTGAPGFTGDRQWNNGGFEFQLGDEKLRSVELIGRREGTTPVLTNEIADQLRGSLPALPRLAKSWSLLYSLDQHGVSLQTFYARCAARVAGTLIVMRDSEDRIFGAWMSEQVRMSPGAYYGSGESFLWRSIPHLGHEHIEVFKWTGKNEYVALCEPVFISFGGGEGKYGLYLDANLIDGSSARCPTFDNEVLCDSIDHDTSKTVPFECVGLEAWAVAM